MCHVRAKSRPGSGHYPMQMKFGGVWWQHCPASLRIWECLICLTHFLVSKLPLAIPSLSQVPWPQRMLQLCQGCPGHLGTVQELLQVWGAALKGRAVAKPSLFLVEMFVYTQMLEIQNSFSYQKNLQEFAFDGMEEFLRPCLHKTLLRDFVPCIWESKTRKTVGPSSSFLVHVGLIRKLKLK